MRERILPRYSFEAELPKGWYLSRLCNSKKVKGYRVLYFNDIIAARIIDTFNLENEVKEIINNPPESVQEALFLEGQISLDKVSPDVRKSLIKKNIVSYEEAYTLFPELSPWLDSYVPKVAEYSGKTYTAKGNRWYDSEDNCINDKYKFNSIWDARVKYAQEECTLQDVARYSWSAVLECLGDNHQRYIDQRLMPKLLADQHSEVCIAKMKKESKLRENEQKWSWTEFDQTAKIQETYVKSVNNTLYKYFTASKEHHVQMFTEECKLEGFKSIKGEIEAYENKIVKMLRDITPELNGFKWNDCLKAQEPVFAPKPMAFDKKEEFFELVHSVIVGKMSGHEAALYLTNAAWFKIERERDRYEKHLTQYVPFYSDCWQKLDAQRFSFGSSVAYVRDSIKDLIRLGFRDKSKPITAFNYDGLRFTINVDTEEVNYVGLAGGNYLSEKWIRLKPEVRRRILNDDAEWKYQEKAIKKYNKLFSFLYNVVHKHWHKTYIVKDGELIMQEKCYYQEDKMKAKRKYLRPSTGFFNKMKERADKYINSLERGVVTC